MNTSNKHPKLTVFDIASDAPIAAVDGEMPELIFLEISRKKIEACDTKAVLERLHQLTADRDTVLAGKGRLFLLIGGYDSDVRALPQVAQYSAFMSALIDAWPYFGWFCALDSDFPAEFSKMMLPHERPGGAFVNVVLANHCDSVANSSTEKGSANAASVTALSVDRAGIAATVDRLFEGIFELGEDHHVPESTVKGRIQDIGQQLDECGLLGAEGP